MHSDVYDYYEPVWFKFNVMIYTSEFYYFHASLCDLNCDSRSQRCEKAEAPVSTYLKKF